MRVERLLESARERLVTISDKAQLTEAATRLGDGRIGLVVVCDHTGRMSGVVSKTDIVSRIGHCQGSSCVELVSGVMTREVTYSRPENTLEEVWGLMKVREVVNVPVVDQNNKPVGTLAARDVLHALLGEVEHEETLLRDYVMGIGYR